MTSLDVPGRLLRHGGTRIAFATRRHIIRLVAGHKGCHCEPLHTHVRPFSTNVFARIRTGERTPQRLTRLARRIRFDEQSVHTIAAAAAVVRRLGKNYG